MGNENFYFKSYKENPNPITICIKMTNLLQKKKKKGKKKTLPMQIMTSSFKILPDA